MDHLTTQPPDHPYSDTEQREDGFHHVAIVDIPAGVVILKNAGSKIVPSPTMHSSQVGVAQHSESYAPKRFTEHSCEPNCAYNFDQIPWEMVSVKPIKKGEDITTFYPHTEYDICNKFDCECGSAQCLGVIKGYRYLSQEKKDEIEPYISPVIRQLRSQSSA